MLKRSSIVWVAFVLLAAACGRESALPEASPTEPPALASPTLEPILTTSPSPSPSPTESPSPTASAIPAGCRNSTNKACGVLSFDPPVGKNQPISLTVSISPAHPEPGDQVTFTLQGSDPDSHLLYLGTYRFAKNGPGVIGDTTIGRCPTGYGPWDPPKKSAGSTKKVLKYTYRDAGTYEAYFSLFSHSYADKKGSYVWPERPPGNDKGLCVDPLTSTAALSVKVKVAAAASPSPSPTPT